MDTAIIHGCSIRPDGTKDTFWTHEVPMKDAPMAHHKLGLSWTASGYGKAIPSSRMIQFNGRWRRVYVAIWSNSGTAYIKTAAGESITVSD